MDDEKAKLSFPLARSVGPQQRLQWLQTVQSHVKRFGASGFSFVRRHC